MIKKWWNSWCCRHEWKNKYFEWSEGPFTTRIPFSVLQGVAEIHNESNNHLNLIYSNNNYETEDSYSRVALDLIHGQLEAYLRWLNDSKS